MSGEKSAEGKDEVEGVHILTFIEVKRHGCPQ